MALRETTHTADSDLFRQELSNIINLRHPLVQLSEKIDWQSCESRFGGLYATRVGRPGQPSHYPAIRMTGTPCKLALSRPRV
ncbi:MAG: hypothetical protein KGN32_13800 [Burkholderiales bacterium]|nr:hypothetical protein [Burkholderiales bacterium]